MVLIGAEMAADMLDIMLEIDATVFSEAWNHDSLLCEILESYSKQTFGRLQVMRSQVENSKSVRSFKRKQNTTFAQPPKAPKKDVSQIFEDLNIVPQLSSDLQCAMCSYRATTKASLKVHYKLKHLGGADLVETCHICKKSIKMKKALKRHLMNVHKLDEPAAQKMIS